MWCSRACNLYSRRGRSTTAQLSQLKNEEPLHRALELRTDRGPRFFASPSCLARHSCCCCLLSQGFARALPRALYLSISISISISIAISNCLSLSIYLSLSLPLSLPLFLSFSICLCSFCPVFSFFTCLSLLLAYVCV